MGRDTIIKNPNQSMNPYIKQKAEEHFEYYTKHSNESYKRKPKKPAYVLYSSYDYGEMTIIQSVYLDLYAACVAMARAELEAELDNEYELNYYITTVELKAK